MHGSNFVGWNLVALGERFSRRFHQIHPTEEIIRVMVKKFGRIGKARRAVKALLCSKKDQIEKTAKEVLFASQGLI